MRQAKGEEMTTQVTYKSIKDLYKVIAEIDENQMVTVTLIPWAYEPIKYVNTFDMTTAPYMEVVNSLSGLVDISIAEYNSNPHDDKYQDSDHKVEGE